MRAVIGQLSRVEHGLLNSKVCFSPHAKCLLKKTFETSLKEKYANKEKEQNMETDNDRFDDSSHFLWKPINCPHV